MAALNEALLFPLADAIQAPMYLIEGKFRLHKEITMKVGPWNLKAELVGRSDELSATRATVLVRLRKSLWAYFVSEVGSFYCLLLDGDKTGLKTSDVDSFCAGDAAQTVGRLKPAAVVAGYEFKDEKWSSFDVSGDLVQRFKK